MLRKSNDSDPFGCAVRRLTRETCDELAKIPMHGSVESLNVSVSAGICLFKARRLSYSLVDPTVAPDKVVKGLDLTLAVLLMLDLSIRYRQIAVPSAPTFNGYAKSY